MTFYNVITVNVGDKYSHEEYTNRLQRAVRRHLHAPHAFYCITDRTKGTAPAVYDLPVPVVDGRPLDKWWPKLAMFSREWVPQNGRLIFLDLDVVIIKDFTDLVANYHGDLCGDKDHVLFGRNKFSGSHHPEYGRIDCSYGSAFVSHKPASRVEVWEKYCANRDAVERVFADHGDQVFTSWATQGRFDLWEDIRPHDHGFYSYRLDYKRPRDKPPVQMEKVRMFNLHGKPKPKFAAEDDPIIRSNWI